MAFLLLRALKAFRIYASHSPITTRIHTLVVEAAMQGASLAFAPPLPQQYIMYGM